jgi:hypothetical protein
MGEPPYQSEEGFEVLAHDGRLYVGMEADNAFGARLWRTRSGVEIARGQEDWEEVAAVGDEPFGNPNAQAGILQNDHIDSLAAFEDVLYASTANGGWTEQGTLIYTSTTGASGTWNQAITAGFGYTTNTNFKDMQVFRGWLCGGTQNWKTGAQVWCTDDGQNWQQKNVGGFGRTEPDTRTVEVWSGYAYDGALYFGAQNAGAMLGTNDDDLGFLYRTRELAGTPTWTRVYTGPPGSYRVDLLGGLNGYLYVATTSEEGVIILRSARGGAGTWQQVNTPGMDGDPNNAYVIVDGATPYNDALYVAVSNYETGVEVWRTTGALQEGGNVDWAQVGSGGLGDRDNVHAELIPFNGYLYAWVSNYVSGQRVLRTACPLCQRVTVTGPGAYALIHVGATITLTSGTVPDVITACVYPEAPPLHPLPLSQPRHYEITLAPTDSYTVDISLAYGEKEHVNLHHWQDGQWVKCANEGSLRAGRGTCRGTTVEGTWAATAVVWKRLWFPLIKRVH